MSLSRFFLSFLCLFGFAACLNSPVEAAETPFQAFFQQHCIDCHGPDLQEAEVRLDTLPSPSLTGPGAETWRKVVDVLEHREMPPKDAPRPETAEIQKFLGLTIAEIARSSPGRPVALRRMNRREYENTVHDLLGIDVPLFDLLPADNGLQGFDNVAGGLMISTVLMEQYLKAADFAFDAAIRRIQPLPPEVRHVKLMDVKDNIESVKQNKGGVIEVEGSFVKFTPGWPPARVDPVHPIEDGVYRCRVAIWPHQPSERTISVAVYVGTLFGPQTRKFIGIFDATGTPQEPRIIEFQTRMNEGDTILVEPRIWPEHVTWRDKHEPRPGVGIAWAETYGPLDQSFPSEAQKKLFGDVPSITMVEEKPIWMRHRKNVKRHIVYSSQPREDVERILRDFLPRAFRRPVTEQELQPYIQLAYAELEAGNSFEQAVRTGVTAILCSPQFLLLNQTPVDQNKPVDDYTLASRLSYFLWSSMPDEELLQLAAAGKLSDPEVRSQQVDRMLADPRAERFVGNFTGQWLSLRRIEVTTPDKKLYPEFDELLQEAMLGETRNFFRHILKDDLSVLNFVDSDFTFLNERLARHYGLTHLDGSPVKGHEKFQKVLLPDDSIRGGVMTHASILKITANGTTTSPVLRGLWVLEHLLNRPSLPPPPGVPAVEPDIRGATTIREQMEKHREISTCASCHRRIDPPGFALEEFDAIGGSRDWYRSLGGGEKIPGNKSYMKGPEVESGDELPDGREFGDFQGFRDRLMEHPELIARAVATKLLVYATGRELTLAERPVIDKIVEQTRPDNYGLKSMIHVVIESELFLMP